MNNNININTNFQTGDNNIHIGPQERHLNREVQNQLISLIPSGKEIDLVCILGDGESYVFATEIKSFLESKGYKVDGVNQAVFSGPVKGQILEQPKEGSNTYKIIIGYNQV
jgi:hypothetical protein